MKRQWISAVIMIISLLVFYLLILPKLNISQFMYSLKNTDLTIYALALLSLLLSNVMASLRWAVLVKEVNAEQSSRFFNALGMFCFGQIAGLVVPSRVGNYTKIPLVKKLDNLSYEAIISAVNAETLIDLAYICFAGVLSIFILFAIFSNFPAFSLVLVILIMLIFFGLLILFLNVYRFQSVYEKLVFTSSAPDINGLVRFCTKSLAKLFELIQSTSAIFSKRAVVAQVSLLTLVTQLFGILGLFLIIESVHTSLPLLDIFAILTITYIVGIASLIPGGLGASDLSLIALLGYEGIPLAVATNIMILWRVAMYLPVLLVVGIYFLQRKIKREDMVLGG